MAVHRTRKDKEAPHYGFLVSWQPKPNSQARVKRELKSAALPEAAEAVHTKNANNWAQATLTRDIKKDIVRSLLIISLTLIAELVVYLAWSKFVLS